MAPPTTNPLLSPAELNYLHTSLSQTPPLRPDGRTPTQFRPLIAETALLPATNGSARVCWSEGEECIVGVKCEVERTTTNVSASAPDQDHHASQSQLVGDPTWVSLSIEIPGFRDDDALPVFLSAMLSEALVQSGFLARRLVINARWHWRVYIDILLLSPPLSYPLPLLSMTTHLALLDTHLPRLISEGDEDPLFDDDWYAAVQLYSTTPLSGLQDPSQQQSTTPSESQPKLTAENPPITLLTTAINNKILFDPSREEIAVADKVIAISLASSIPASPSSNQKSKTTNSATADSEPKPERSYTLLSIRIIDSPARLTPRGLTDDENPATNTNTNTNNTTSSSTKNNTFSSTPSKSTPSSNPSGTGLSAGGIWSPPLGGMSRTLLSRIIGLCIGDVSRGQVGVAGEVFEGLMGFVGSS